ncbi:hypothetical protein HN51_054846, partial [Arachis hypogaea]
MKFFNFSTFADFDPDLNYHCSLLLPLLVALAIAIVTVDVQASFAMDGTLLLASLSIAKALLEIDFAFDDHDAIERTLVAIIGHRKLQSEESIVQEGSQVEDSKPEPDAPTWSPLSERRIVSDRFLRSPVLDSPILPPLKFYTALLTPQNIAFSFGDDTDESTVSLPDDADSSDEELSAPSNLDYLERPISHCYDEDELFGCKLLKPQRSNGVLKK